MSLEIDGVWKGGLWASTVWAEGVWRVGPYEPPSATVNPKNILTIGRSSTTIRANKTINTIKISKGNNTIKVK